MKTGLIASLALATLGSIPCRLQRCSLLAVVLLITPTLVLAGKPLMQKEQKELALFSCLARNYKAIGGDISSHEWSAFHPRYVAITKKRYFEYDLKYSEFIEKQTGNFYKEEIGVKAEVSKPPYTTIFAKCIEFSESKALRDFIAKNPL